MKQLLVRYFAAFCYFCSIFFHLSGKPIPDIHWRAWTLALKGGYGGRSSHAFWKNAIPKGDPLERRCWFVGRLPFRWSNMETKRNEELWNLFYLPGRCWTTEEYFDWKMPLTTQVGQLWFFGEWWWGGVFVRLSWNPCQKIPKLKRTRMMMMMMSVVTSIIATITIASIIDS